MLDPALRAVSTQRTLPMTSARPQCEKILIRSIFRQSASNTNTYRQFKLSRTILYDLFFPHFLLRTPQRAFGGFKGWGVGGGEIPARACLGRARQRKSPLASGQGLKKRLNTALNALNKTNIDTGRTCPGLQVWGQPDPQRPFAVCAPEQEQQCNADRNNGYIYFIFIDMHF